MNQVFNVVVEVVVVGVSEEEEVHLCSFPVLLLSCWLCVFSYFDLVFFDLRFWLVFIFNHCFVVMEKVGIFALSLLFRVETIYVPLNHPVLSNVDRLGLFHFFPDVQPLELFLVVLKNVFDFQ